MAASILTDLASRYIIIPNNDATDGRHGNITDNTLGRGVTGRWLYVG